MSYRELDATLNRFKYYKNTQNMGICYEFLNFWPVPYRMYFFPHSAIENTMLCIINIISIFIHHHNNIDVIKTLNIYRLKDVLYLFI